MQKSWVVTETFINIQRSTSPFEDLYSAKNNSNEDALAPRHNPRRIAVLYSFRDELIF